jgi:hypothetical protein
MPEAFDPYHIWLGIPPEEQPANRYRLLGIRAFETNPDVIESAADRQMAYLRTLQSGKNARLSQQLLNEVSATRVCLLNPQAKAAYDQQLRAALAAVAPPRPAVGPIVSLPVAHPIGSASPQAPPPAANWDQLIGDVESRPRMTSGQSIRSASARRASKNRLIYVCVTAGLLLAAAAGIAYYALSANADGVLAFDWPAAERAGIALKIDEQRVAIPASGPWEYRLPPGEHHIVGSRGAYKLETTVSLEAGGEQAIAPNWKPTAAVDKQQTIAVSTERDGTLVIDWSPADREGAQLTIDGKERPLDTLTLAFPLKPGRHELRIVRDGFLTIKQTFAVSSQRSETMKPIWKPPEVVTTTGGTPPSEAPPVSDAAGDPTVPPDAVIKKRLPIPSDAEQERIGKQLDETYKAAHSAEKELALAEQLYNLADGVGTSPAERYMLLVRAVGLSAGAADLNSAVHGIDLLDAGFEIDPFEMKQKAVDDSVKSATTAEQVATVTAAAEQLIDQAAADERYDTALAIAEVVGALTSKPSADPRLRKQIAERRREILLLQTASAGAIEAETVLEKDADNPDANLTMGRWYCLYKSDWDRGLPLFAKGPDGPFKSLAKQELAVNLELNYQLQLADGWWDQAQKVNGLPRDSARLHSAEIYRLMLPNLQPSLKKTTIEKRLAESDSIQPHIDQPRQQFAGRPGAWDQFDLGKAKLLNGFVRLTKSENEVISKDAYSGGIDITVVARTERNNIRIYGPHGSSVIFNWERKPGELRINRPDGSDKAESGSLVTVAVPPLVPNKWYSLRWRIADDGMGIWINRKAVFAERRNNNLSAKGRIAVHAVDSNVDVKSISVVPYSMKRGVLEKPPPIAPSATTETKNSSAVKLVPDSRPGSPVQFPRGQWVDLLRMVDTAKDAINGNWVRSGDEISSEAKRYCRIRLSVAIDGSYDLAAEFTRTDGTSDVNTIIPVGSQRCIVMLSASDGKASGIEQIDGHGITDSRNPTGTQPGTLENGHRYKLLIGVRLLKDEMASVDVSLDGKPYLRWQGKLASLSIPERWSLPNPRQPGLGAWKSRVTFHSVRLRMLAGEAVSESTAPWPANLPTIISARWGGGKNWTDVTQRVQEAVARGDAVQVNISFLGADPTPGWKKQLEITYEKAGNQQSAHLNEGQDWSQQDYGL